jgi:pimeloyl-ACP methyl ester carboxylesterase
LSRVVTIETPAIAICGEEDVLTPVKYHQYLHDRMPSCELRVIPKAGHWPFVEQPEVFDRVIREFLAQLPLVRPEPRRTAV